MLTDEQWARIDAIDGWLFRPEADLLHDLITEVREPWCEVGAWKGKATNVFAMAHAFGYVVDWFQGSSEHPAGTNTLAEFNQNTEDLLIRVIPLDYEHGADLVPNGIHLLYLDAEHSYDATAHVFALYSPKVAELGYVVLHDAWGDNGEGKDGGRTPWPGVTQFALELIAGGEWVNVRNVNRCAVFRRA